MASVMTAPATSAGSDSPMSVMNGMSALRSACFPMTLELERPYAFAVRT